MGHFKYLRRQARADLVARGLRRRLSALPARKFTEVISRGLEARSARELPGGITREKAGLRAFREGDWQEIKGPSWSPIERLPGIAIPALIAAVPFYVWAKNICRDPVMDHAHFCLAGMKGRPKTEVFSKPLQPTQAAECEANK